MQKQINETVTGVNKTLLYSEIMFATIAIVGTTSTLFYNQLNFEPFTFFKTLSVTYQPTVPFPIIQAIDVKQNPLSLSLWRAGSNHGLTLIALSSYVIYSAIRYMNPVNTAINIIVIDGVHEGLWAAFRYVEYNVITKTFNNIVVPSSLILVLIAIFITPLMIKKDKNYGRWLIMMIAIFGLWLAIGFPISYSGPTPLFFDLGTSLLENGIWFLSIIWFMVIVEK